MQKISGRSNKPRMINLNIIDSILRQNGPILRITNEFRKWWAVGNRRYDPDILKSGHRRHQAFNPKAIYNYNIVRINS